MNILAPEITAHLHIARTPQIGDLVVMTDFAGRKIGGRLVDIVTGTPIIKILEDKYCYTVGMRVPRDMEYITRAI